jgi:hypothetical protein
MLKIKANLLLRLSSISSKSKEVKRCETRDEGGQLLGIADIFHEETIPDILYNE